MPLEIDLSEDSIESESPQPILNNIVKMEQWIDRLLSRSRKHRKSILRLLKESPPFSTKSAFQVERIKKSPHLQEIQMLGKRPVSWFGLENGSACFDDFFEDTPSSSLPAREDYVKYWINSNRCIKGLFSTVRFKERGGLPLLAPERKTDQSKIYDPSEICHEDFIEICTILNLEVFRKKRFTLRISEFKKYLEKCQLDLAIFYQSVRSCDKNFEEFIERVKYGDIS